MANWGGAWAGLSQQAFGASMDSLRGMQQDKQLKAREEAAQRAADERERVRRQWEEQMEIKRSKRAQQERASEVASTYVDPQTGQIVPVTRGQISSGEARVPEFELERQRAAAEMADQDAGLKGMKTQADIEAARARADQARASAGLSRAKMENPERFRAPPAETLDPDVKAARALYNMELSRSGGDPEKAKQAVKKAYGSDIANRALPGEAESQDNAAEFVARLFRGLGAGSRQYIPNQ